MAYENKMQVSFDSRSENEGFARVAVASFISQLDPTLEELNDVKTAVSEAVTNAIIHGYDGNAGSVHIECSIKERRIHILIKDEGLGIDNIDQAMEPLYTSKPELERSGMGFAVMQAFMDEVEVESKCGVGTKVHLMKNFEK